MAATPPRAIIYVRQAAQSVVSSSLEFQEARCRDYCTNNGYHVTAVIADIAAGQQWQTRSGAQEVMRRIADGQVDQVVVGDDADRVVVERWWRISRDRIHLIEAISEIEAAGARVESASEPLDTKTADHGMGRMLLEMCAVVDHEDDDGAARG